MVPEPRPGVPGAYLGVPGRYPRVPKPYLGVPARYLGVPKPYPTAPERYCRAPEPYPTPPACQNGTKTTCQPYTDSFQPLSDPQLSTLNTP